MKKVGVLISGRGSNLAALMAAQGETYKIVLVISNIEGAEGLARAAEAGVATRAIPHHGKTREAFDAEMDAALRAAGVDYVCLAGFMRILSDGLVRGWEGRLINIHPSLLPAYKGTRVHERVIAAGEAQSGASVHFVVPELDAGPVIAQARVPVHPDDSPDILAARVLDVEHQLYPAALRLLADGKVKLEKGLAVFGYSPSTMAPMRFPTSPGHASLKTGDLCEISQSTRVVARLFGRRRGFAFVEIFAVVQRHIGRGRQIDDGLGALFRRDRAHRLGDSDQPLHDAARLIAEAGGDKAGMQAIGGDAGAGDAPRQFAGEQNIAELGVGIDAKAHIALAALQVVKVKAGALVRVRGGRDDARPGLQLRQQQVGDGEIGHVVEGERLLQPIGGFAAPVEQRPGIVDQHVDPRFGGNLARHALLFRQQRQVGQMGNMFAGVVGLLQFRHGGVGAGPVPGGEDNAGALLRQPDGSDFADAGSGAGYHDGFSAHEKGSRP